MCFNQLMYSMLYSLTNAPGQYATNRSRLPRYGCMIEIWYSFDATSYTWVKHMHFICACLVHQKIIVTGNEISNCFTHRFPLYNRHLKSNYSDLQLCSIVSLSRSDFYIKTHDSESQGQDEAGHTR